MNADLSRSDATLEMEALEHSCTPPVGRPKRAHTHDYHISWQGAAGRGRSKAEERHTKAFAQ